ncbi:MAG: hypothetical protein WB660_04380 [Candidatus Sulfotelmatobacter sp.]
MNKRLVIFFLVLISMSPLTAGQRSPKEHFTAVGLNLFVHVVLTNADGKTVETEFIVDTGTTRTTIDVGIADLLHLKPFEHADNVTPNGKTVRNIARLPKVSALSRSSIGLKVVLDDLSMYSKAYNRTVGGFLAMDFLKDYDLFIDFPQSQIALLSSDAQLDKYGHLLTVAVISEKGLPLIPISLPSGKTVRVIFDTGCDAPADALLFKTQVEDLNLLPPITYRTSSDQNGQVLTQIGTVAWLGLGFERLAPASVEVSPTASPKMFSFQHAGMIGLFPFQSGLVALNFPRQTLMVSTPLRANIK